MAAGSCPKHAILAQPSLPQRSGLTWAQWIAQPGRTIWDLATTTSTVASMWLATLGCLQRQTKLPLHGDCRSPRTREKSEWPWNVKSRIRKAEPRKTHKAGLHSKNWWLTTTLQSPFLAPHNLYLRAFEIMVAQLCCNSHAASFVVETWSEMGPINSPAWKTILGPCHYNFKSGLRAIGKTRVPPNTGKTTASNLVWNDCKKGTAWNNNFGIATTTSTVPSMRLAIGKTRVAPKTGKTITAWWVESNQKSNIFLRCTTTQSWSTLGPFQTMVAGSCPKLAIFVQP